MLRKRGARRSRNMICHEANLGFTPQTAIREYWQHAYRVRRLGGASPSTITYHLHELDNFDHAFRSILAEQNKPPREPVLADLRDEVLSAVMRRRVQVDGCSAATANKIHKVITPIWRMAKRNGLVEQLPDVELFPVPRRVRSVPTPSRLEQIIEACRQAPGYVDKIPARLWWPALCLVDVNLGVRIRALMNVRRADLDLENRRVLVRGEFQKHGADQWFELLPRTIEAIEPLLAWREKLLFPWPWDPNPYNWTTLRRHYKRILRRANLPYGPEQMFHAFRRYTATRITAAAGIEAAQQYLGHSCVKVTRSYVDPLQGVGNRSASVAFPELMGDAPEPPQPPSSPDQPSPDNPGLPPSDPPESGGQASFLRVFRGDELAG